MEARDFYIKVTAPSGVSSIRRHRVWDADLFLRNMQAQYAKDKDGPHTVAVSSEEEFKQQVKK